MEGSVEDAHAEGELLPEQQHQASTDEVNGATQMSQKEIPHQAPGPPTPRAKSEFLSKVPSTTHFWKNHS